MFEILPDLAELPDFASTPMQICKNAPDFNIAESQDQIWEYGIITEMVDYLFSVCGIFWCIILPYSL